MKWLKSLLAMDDYNMGKHRARWEWKKRRAGHNRPAKLSSL